MQRVNEYSLRKTHNGVEYLECWQFIDAPETHMTKARFISSFGRYCRVNQKGEIKITYGTKHIGRYRKIEIDHKSILVHRLVYKHFGQILDFEERELEINHIDFNKSNNCIWNLEAITSNENLAHYHNTLEDPKTRYITRPVEMEIDFNPWIPTEAPRKINGKIYCEEWAFFDDYTTNSQTKACFVSSFGRICLFNHKGTGRIHRGSINNSHGYYQFNYSSRITKKAVCVLVHRLVYMLFENFDNQGLTIDHIDGNKHNNAIYNLDACSKLENIMRYHERHR